MQCTCAHFKNRPGLYTTTYSSFHHPPPAENTTPPPGLLSLPALSVVRLMTVISEQPPAEAACSSGKTQHSKQHIHTGTTIKDISIQHAVCVYKYTYRHTHKHTHFLHSTSVTADQYRKVYTNMHINQPSTVPGADIQIHIHTQTHTPEKKSVHSLCWGWCQCSQGNG